jgi:predicted membrane channel-forming protein YqfA (hemolysin III family)
MHILADIATGEFDTADVLLLIASIVAVVGILVQFVPVAGVRPAPNLTNICLFVVVGLIAFSLMLW